MFSSSRFLLASKYNNRANWCQTLTSPVDSSTTTKITTSTAKTTKSSTTPSIPSQQRLALLLKRAQFLQLQETKNFPLLPFSRDWSGMKAATFCFSVSNLLGGAADKCSTDQAVKTLVETVWNAKQKNVVVEYEEDRDLIITSSDVRSILSQQQQKQQRQDSSSSSSSSIFFSSRSAELICNCLWRSIHFHSSTFLMNKNNKNNNNSSNNNETKNFYTKSRLEQVDTIRQFLNVIGYEMMSNSVEEQEKFSLTSQRKLAWEDVHNISFLVTRAVSILPSPEAEIFDHQTIPFVNNCFGFCRDVICFKKTSKNVLTLKYPGVFNILTMIHSKSKLKNEVDADRAASKLTCRDNINVLVSQAIDVIAENSRTCALEPLNKKQMTQIVLSLGFMEIYSAELLVALSPQIYSIEPRKEQDQEHIYHQHHHHHKNSSSSKNFQMRLPKLEIVLINFVLSSAQKLRNDNSDHLHHHRESTDTFFREKTAALMKVINVQKHGNPDKNISKQQSKNNNKNKNNTMRESFFALTPKSIEIDAAFQLIQMFVSFSNKKKDEESTLSSSSSSSSSLFADPKTWITVFKLCCDCLVPTLQPGANWLDLRDIVRVATVGRRRRNFNKKDDLNKAYNDALSALEFRIRGKIHQGLKRVHFETVTLPKEEFEKKIQKEKNIENSNRRRPSCFPFARDFDLDCKMLSNVAPFVFEWICAQHQQSEEEQTQKLIQEAFSLFVSQVERLTLTKTESSEQEVATKTLIRNLLTTVAKGQKMVFEEMLKQELVKKYFTEEEIEKVRQDFAAGFRSNEVKNEKEEEEKNVDQDHHQQQSQQVDEGYMDII